MGSAQPSAPNSLDVHWAACQVRLLSVSRERPWNLEVEDDPETVVDP